MDYGSSSQYHRSSYGSKSPSETANRPNMCNYTKNRSNTNRLMFSQKWIVDQCFQRSHDGYSCCVLMLYNNIAYTCYVLVFCPCGVCSCCALIMFTHVVCSCLYLCCQHEAPDQIGSDKASCCTEALLAQNSAPQHRRRLRAACLSAPGFKESL